MPMAVDATRRFRGRGIATDDLEQVAYLGLVKAVQGFDPDRGHDFLSFAIPTIRGEVRRHFRDLGWTVRPPRSIQETQTKIIASEPELYQKLGRAPRPTDLAAHLDLELETVIDALGASGCFAPASLDAPDARRGGRTRTADRLHRLGLRPRRGARRARSRSWPSSRSASS